MVRLTKVNICPDNGVAQNMQELITNHALLGFEEVKLSKPMEVLKISNNLTVW